MFTTFYDRINYDDLLNDASIWSDSTSLPIERV